MQIFFTTKEIDNKLALVGEYIISLYGYSELWTLKADGSILQQSVTKYDVTKLDLLHHSQICNLNEGD